MIKTFYALNRTNKTENTDIFGVSLYQFVRKHTAKMAGKFYSIISEEEMEDLVHDTYIKVCEKKGNFNPEGNFYGWAFRICQNCVRDFASSKKAFNEKFIPIDYDYDNDDAPDIDCTSILGDETFCPDRAVIEDEFKEKFWGSLDRLNSGSRKIADLLMEETPYEEMANELNCSSGSLRVKIFRTRKELERMNIAG